MTKEYIEREAAKKAFCEFCDWAEAGSEYCQSCPDPVGRIPAADVAPVRHGLWLTKEYMYGDPETGLGDMWIDRPAEQSDFYAYCSECGEDAGCNGEGSLILSDCCPSCGARMDGGR